MSEYNAAIADVIKSIDNFISGLDRQIASDNSDELYAQRSAMHFLRVHIGTMAKNPAPHFLPDDPISYRSIRYE